MRRRPPPIADLRTHPAAMGTGRRLVSVLGVLALTTGCVPPTSADATAIERPVEPEAGSVGGANHAGAELQSSANPRSAQRGRARSPRSAPAAAPDLVVEEVEIESHDGVTLHGWVGRPDVDAPVPVVLAITPYLELCREDVLIHQAQANPTAGACIPEPSEESWRRSEGDDGIQVWFETGLYPMDLVSRGYAVALVSVRGTGRSGGCFELTGANEQDDAAVVAEWFGGQTWSSGRVAMFGRSYSTSPAFSAAIDRAPSLEAVLVTGLITDLYGFQATPQGAAYTIAGPFWSLYWQPTTGVLPAVVSSGRPDLLPDRLCTAVAENLLATNVAPSDARDHEFYEERRLLDDFDQITTPVLVAHGFADYQGGSSHRTQESAVFRALTRAPKRQIEGHWGHYFPEEHRATLDPRWRSDTWSEIAFDWLDHYLRRRGPRPERLGTVDFQDSAGTWHASRTWPPAEARDEVLYLTTDALAPAPDGSTRRFQDAGDVLQDERVLFHDSALCPSPLDAAPSPVGLAYLTDPLGEPLTLAGDPYAYLDVTSSQPGGIVAVTLWELTPEFSCSPVPGLAQPGGPGATPGASLISSGAADLRFHDGRFRGTDFRGGHVRVDLVNLAERIEAGHRLAVTISGGGASVYAGQPYSPTITIGGAGGTTASHLVLPVLEGTLRGHDPVLDYPSRPFVPAP